MDQAGSSITEPEDVIELAGRFITERFGSKELQRCGELQAELFQGEWVVMPTAAWPQTPTSESPEIVIRYGGGHLEVVIALDGSLVSVGYAK